LSTPFFRLQALLLGRFFIQNPEILSSMQMENFYFRSLLKKMKKEFLALKKMIEKKDRDSFRKKFKQVSFLLEDFKKIALVKSNEILSLIEQQPLKNFFLKKINMKNLSVGFLGPQGTFSHEAAIKIFSLKSRFCPFESLREIFEAVNNGKIDFGLVPFENSITGLIGETVNLLIEYPLFVSGSFILPVCQALLAWSKDKKEIEEIRTLPQAYFQSQRWIKNYLGNIKISFTNSTTDAILKTKDKKVAFIASPFCAKIYNLYILKKNIQDQKENFTKFFLISQKSNKEIIKRLKAQKALLLLAVYDRVGILRDILDIFAKRKINLTSLHSIPSHLKAWDYFFFLEAEVNPFSSLFKEVFNELERFCSLCRFLGQS
ncbi:MAG: prephenate dehydratase domain-containing protein, partial [Minisyncoccales bacterium]